MAFWCEEDVAGSGGVREGNVGRGYVLSALPPTNIHDVGVTVMLLHGVSGSLQREGPSTSR